jgi:hypothetical protein
MLIARTHAQERRTIRYFGQAVWLTGSCDNPRFQAETQFALRGFYVLRWGKGLLPPAPIVAKTISLD